jgi:heat-inducible transcriptional repressor
MWTCCSSRRAQPGQRQALTVNDILSKVSHELSQASHQLGFALLPTEEGTFQHIEFAPLEGTRILVVVSTSHAEVAHKVVDLGSAVAASDLQQGANHLNAEFAGRPLHTVRAAMVEQLRQERILYDALLSRALKIASSTLEEMAAPASVFLEGASFLLEGVSDATDHAPLSTLRALLAMIEHKDRLVRILTAYIEGPGLTVRIGTEHQSPEMQDFGLVMSTYSDGQRTGGVGVIGLRRMRYSRAIATVDRVSRAVTRVLVEPQSRPLEHEQRDETGHV